MGCGRRDVPPTLWPRSRKLVHLLDGDVSGSILVQCLNDRSNVHEIDVFKGPGVVLGDTTSTFLSSIDLEGVLLIVLLLQVILADCKNKVACFDDAPPSLRKSQSPTLQQQGRAEPTYIFLPDLA